MPDMSFVPRPCSDRWALAFGRLVGFFAGDGGTSPTTRNSVDFHLKKARKVEYLREIASDLGWALREGSTLRLRCSKIADYFREHGYRGSDKVLPAWVLDMDQPFQKSVLDGLRNSDGSQKRRAWVYSTVSAPLAEQVQVLALHCGEAANLRRSGPMFCLNVNSRSREPVVNQDKKNTGREYYDGTVYCATTRTGLMVVRRNGKVVLSGNTSPFEQVVFTFHMRMPIFIARQYVRYRTARLNEESARYGKLAADFYVPTAERMLRQAKKNKQGSAAESVSDPEQARRDVKAISHAAYRLYESLLERGLARELARMVLPTNIYTQWFYQMDLHNLMRLMRQRLHSHAQWESRRYAEAILPMARALAPYAMDAFEEEVL